MNLRHVLVFSLLLASCEETAASAALAEDEAPIEGICVHDGEGEGEGDPFADCVESFRPGEGASFGHDALPDIVLGAPGGGDAHVGSLDVASLGCGGQITLSFAEPILVDREGPDFIVFENAFENVATGSVFSEPGRVLVSDDGISWAEFSCTLDGRGTWPATGCAGVHPVLANGENGLATSASRAGGDAFDLAEVGLTEARYVRIIDAGEAHFGNRTWCAGASGGFDLDAIARVEHP